MEHMILKSIRLSSLSNADDNTIIRHLRNCLNSGDKQISLRPEQVTVFRVKVNNDVHTSAVVRGLPLTWGEVRDLLDYQAIIGGKAFHVSPDHDQKRDPVTGDIVEKWTGAETQFVNKLYMKRRAQMPLLWTEEVDKFLTSFTYSNDLVISNVGVYDRKGLFAGGRCLQYKYKKSTDQIIITYFTLLEKMQSQFYLCGNEDFSKTAQFVHQSNRAGGFAENGDLIRVADFERDPGYIPFDEISSFFINDLDSHQIFSQCYKCDLRGTLRLKGILPCGGYLAAVCDNHDYNYDRENSNVLEQNIPVTCFGEKFTRVRIGNSNFKSVIKPNLPFALNEMHHPLRLQYSSASEARDIHCSIFSHETFVNRKVFELSNTKTGELQSAVFVEHFPAEPPSLGHNDYLCLVEMTKFGCWKLNSVKQFHHVTVSLKGDVEIGERMKSCTLDFNGKVKGMDAIKEDSSKILVSLRVLVREDFTFGPPEHVKLVPHSPDYERASITSVFSKWTANPSKLKFSLLNKMFINQDGFSLPLDADIEDLGLLNGKQFEALKGALSHELFCLHGPPGTGKTFTAAVILLQLARLVIEKKQTGICIGVTKTNAAADNLADKIMKLIQLYPELFRNVFVVRMSSVKVEEQYYRNLPETDNGAPGHECGNWLTYSSLISSARGRRCRSSSLGWRRLLIVGVSSCWKKFEIRQ